MDTVIFDLDDTLIETWGATRRANISLMLFFMKKRLFRIVLALIRKENNEFIKNSGEMLLLDSYIVIGRFMRYYYPDIGQDVIDRASDLFHEVFYRHLRTVDGALEILDYLSEKYRLCLVTDGSVRWQNEKIDMFGLRKYFEKIIISGETGVSKLKPDNFLRAMPPQEKAYVVGDRMETDIRNGGAAGAETILFKHGFFTYEERGEVVPDHRISALCELRTIL